MAGAYTSELPDLGYKRILGDLAEWFVIEEDDNTIASLSGLNDDEPLLTNIKINDRIEGPDNGMEPAELRAKLTSGHIKSSLVNAFNVIKLEGFKLYDGDYKTMDLGKISKFSDLCDIDSKNSPALVYVPDDFLYCSNVNHTLNHMITLRRFPYPCIDNIWDLNVQKEPDICRMITYFNQETNRLEDILTFDYGLRWKSLTASSERLQMEGEQSGLSGMMKTIGTVMGDSNLIKNRLRGYNANQVDPQQDPNRVFGPVDSINETHIRDVGFDFNKEFSLIFEYTMRSYGGRTPEHAMKDILANVLACTFNDGKFWGGARYWVGEQPSNALEKYRWMNSDNIDHIVNSAVNLFKDTVSNIMKNVKESAIGALKRIISGGVSMMVAKLLDGVGRPGIVLPNSLLSNAPVGEWHLTIGHPLRPILTMGNLICTNTQISFPTDSLSYGDFPTKMKVEVRLKPAMPRDRAGIEMMFNMGKSRIYFPKKSIKVSKNSVKGGRSTSFSLTNWINNGVDAGANMAISTAKKVGNINIYETYKQTSSMVAEYSSPKINHAKTALIDIKEGVEKSYENITDMTEKAWQEYTPKAAQLVKDGQSKVKEGYNYISKESNRTELYQDVKKGAADAIDKGKQTIDRAWESTKEIYGNVSDDVKLFIDSNRK